MNRREMKVSNFLHMQYLTPIKKKFFFSGFQSHCQASAYFHTKQCGPTIMQQSFL